MIQTRLFQVSAVPDKHQALSGVAIDVTHLAGSAVADAQRAAAAARDPYVVTFTQTYDPEKATAWLAECFRRNHDEIDRMSPQEQSVAVIGVWRAFGNYFKALNVRPYCLQKYRRVCAQAWGGPPVGPTDESASRTLERDSRPYMTWEHPGDWRTEAARRFMGDRRSPRTVIFGSGNENDETDIDNNFGCSSSNVVLNADCPPPAEIHRCWLQNNGSVTGHIWTHGEVADGGVLDGDNTDMDGQDDGTDDDPSDPRFWNWRAGAWEDSTPAVGQNRLFVVAPLLWYWRMLCAPFPGLKVEDGGPDVSLVEWLWRMGPVEVLRAAKRDTIIKNTLMLSARGAERLADIMGDQERRELAAYQSDLSDRRQIGSALLQMAGTAAATVSVPGLVVGAVLGLAGAVVSLAPGLFGEGEIVSIDIFGRRMTVVEVYSMQDAGAAISYLETVPDPTSPLPLTDPHLPGPPPAPPRPSTPTIILTPVFVPPQPTDPHSADGSVDVIEAKSSGPSAGGVIAAALVSIAAGVAVNRIISSRRRRADATPDKAVRGR